MSEKELLRDLLKPYGHPSMSDVLYVRQLRHAVLPRAYYITLNRRGKQVQADKLLKKLLKNYQVSIDEPEFSGLERASGDSLDGNAKNYLNGIQSRFAFSWIMPVFIEGRPDTIVEFTVRRNGQIANLHLLKASDDKAADEGAKDAIRLASPLPKPPASLIDANIRFRFR